MNLLRVWGDIYMLPHEFYTECDRRGFLLWQDFMFGHGMHPGGKPEFDDNCRKEVEEIVPSLRNHPRLLLSALNAKPVILTLLSRWLMFRKIVIGSAYGTKQG